MIKINLIGNSENLVINLENEDNNINEINNFLCIKYEIENKNIKLIFNGDEINKNSKEIKFENNDNIYFILDGNNLLLN